MKKENNIGNYIVHNQLDIQKVVDDYYNYISKIIKNYSNISLEDEEEIISDVFLIVWKNRNKLDKKLNFSPYIAGITKKVILRKYKKINKEIHIAEYEDNIVDKFNIEKIMEEQEMNEVLIKNLKRIGETEYKIFTKFYYEGKKVKEIAKELGLTTSNVKTKLHRTREKIKDILKIGGF